MSLKGRKDEAHWVPVHGGCSRRPIAAVREAGVMPEMVHIGNEARNGVLWPVGKLPENQDQFAGLVKASLDGVAASLRTPTR